LALVEVLAQPRKQFVGDVDRRAGHGLGVLEHETLEVAELARAAPRRQLAQLLLGVAGVKRQLRAEVEAPFTADQLRGPEHGEVLEPTIDGAREALERS